MPTPNKNEKQKDYMKRCVPMVMDEGTVKNNKQAVAVCYSLWRQHKGKSKSEARLEAVAEEILE
jgi:hypothetical protein